jgi:hypothetical protein
VLAAVAILGIAYITLGSSGIQGLQHEGEARRRLEASLLADSVLFDIEDVLQWNVTPPLGDDEREEGDFRIAVTVAPFSIVVPEETGKDGKRLGDARSRLGGSGEQAQQPVIPGPSLLGGDSGPGAVSPLRRIDVHITWNEGFGERSVSRTTFALDHDAARATLTRSHRRKPPRGPAAATAGRQPARRWQPGTSKQSARQRRGDCAQRARTFEAQSPFRVATAGERRDLIKPASRSSRCWP